MTVLEWLRLRMDMMRHGDNFYDRWKIGKTANIVRIRNIGEGYLLMWPSNKTIECRAYALLNAGLPEP